MPKFFLTLGILISGQAFGAVMAHNQQEVFDHFQQAGFTGVVGVYSSKEPVERAFGAEKGRQITPGDHFLIGSVTKQFTAAAILKLFERGRLGLHDSVGKYIPEFRGRQVTIHQLMAQTSGVREVTASPFFGELKKRKFAGLAPLIRLIASLPPDFRAGSRWAYSNSNYFLLSKIVEVASGEPWWEFVKRELIDAAGMKNTDYSSERGSQLVSGHEFDRDYSHVAIDEVSYLERGWASGAGGIESTVRDLELWNAALFGGKILGPEALGLMTAAQAKSSETESYGYGLFVATEKTTGETYYYHPGGIPGFISYNAYYPRRKLSVVAVANYAATETVEFAAALAALEVAGSATVNSYSDDPNVPRFPMDVLEGVFVASGANGETIELKYDGGRLYMSMDGQPEHRLIVRAKGVFFERSLGSEIRFKHGSNDEFELVTRESRNLFRRSQERVWLYSPIQFLLENGLWF